MTEYNTLLLDRKAWDLVLDSAGNIAMATPPYAIAQDVACAIRTFLGDVWYNQTDGIPYFQKILGHLPPQSYFLAQLQNAALGVSGVVSAIAIIQSIDYDTREVTGQVQFVDESGATNVVNF